MKNTSPIIFFSKFSSGNSNLPKSFLQKQQSFPLQYKYEEKNTKFSEKNLLIILVFWAHGIQGCHLWQKVLTDVKHSSVQTPKNKSFKNLFAECLLRKCSSGHLEGIFDQPL